MSITKIDLVSSVATRQRVSALNLTHCGSLIQTTHIKKPQNLCQKTENLTSMHPYFCMETGAARCAPREAPKRKCNGSRNSLLFIQCNAEAPGSAITAKEEESSVLTCTKKCCARAAQARAEGSHSDVDKAQEIFAMITGRLCFSLELFTTDFS